MGKIHKIAESIDHDMLGMSNWQRSINNAISATWNVIDHDTD